MPRKKSFEKIGAWAVTVGIILLNALCVLIFMEMIGRQMDQHRFPLLNWLFTPLAVYNAVIVASVSGVLFFLTGSLASALFVNNLLFFFLAIVNYLKIIFRSIPLEPNDIFVVREALAVAGNQPIMKYISPLMIGSVLLMVVVMPLLLIKMKKRRIKPMTRIVGIVLMCVLTWAVSVHTTHIQQFYSIVLRDVPMKRGFLSVLADRIIHNQSSKMEEPENYSEETVREEIAGYEAVKTADGVYPNVIYIMSESLFDVNNLFDVSEEVMPYFRELGEKYWAGDFLTEVSGGGTAFTEYQVLTGYRLDDTDGEGYSPLSKAIAEGMDTVVSVLERHGYETTAMHPNTGGFYYRSGVYTKMGFDRMLFSEQLDAPPKAEFPFPSDDYFFDQIIKAYESRDRAKPWFCHAITFQNHGGYGFESSLNRIQVKDELDSDGMLNATNYVNLLRLSDEALRKLIAYFDALSDPTMIVIWGDHAPGIEGYFGMKLPSSAVEKMPYYTTPALIYTNYPQDLSGMPDTLSSYRLSGYVLDLLGIKDDAYFNYLASPDALNLTLFPGLLEENGAYISDQERYDAEAEKLYLLHYDRLNGEGYSKEGQDEAD